MAEKTVVRSSSGGIGFLGALGLLFIALKLTGVIDWSWLWVLAPIWIPWVIAICFILFFGTIALVVSLLDTRKSRSRRKSLDRYGKRMVR